MGAGHVPIVHKPQFKIEGNLVAAITSGNGKISVEDLLELEVVVAIQNIYPFTLRTVIEQL